MTIYKYSSLKTQLENRLYYTDNLLDDQIVDGLDEQFFTEWDGEFDGFLNFAILDQFEVPLAHNLDELADSPPEMDVLKLDRLFVHTLDANVAGDMGASLDDEIYAQTTDRVIRLLFSRIDTPLSEALHLGYDDQLIVQIVHSTNNYPSIGAGH
jgi:hypothetical protein